MNEGILSAIGNTPLVRLRRCFGESDFNVYAKLESHNPGGSGKDRPAHMILQRAYEAGALGPDTVVIESSSGNMGVGLAQACAYYGLRFICVVDAKTNTQNIRLLRAYGAEVEVVTDPDPLTDEYLPVRIQRVQQLLHTVPGSFWVNQYANENNARAHHQMMHEVAAALKGEVDYLFCATSTCGTLRGCREYVRHHGLRTKIFGVDAVGSVIFGGQKSKRLLPGHGAAVRPPLYQHDLADECVLVTDKECVIGCRRLAREEAVLVGGSSGGVLMALQRVAHRIEAGANCVLIFPDRGERYLDTIYSEQWVAEHFGDLTELWVPHDAEGELVPTP